MPIPDPEGNPSELESAGPLAVGVGYIVIPV